MDDGAIRRQVRVQPEPRRHPAEPYALREKGYCASKHPPPEIDRPRHAEPISEGGCIGAIRFTL